ncbi:fimbrial assembly protein FimA [Chromatiales bacterium (ex Bugula neritina AB1)]|nr:fimbrial assembly protein FimA [Chromatiales bacterium (ex Bugula neritina AB1)]
MTFSLVARCASTGMFGVAISSSSPAVAARCAYARAGAGAVASQNITDPRLGPQGLDLLARGQSAADTIKALQENNEHMDYRQVLAVDGNGTVAIHSGSQSLGIFSQAEGENVASGGNLLANDAVPQAIVDAFTASEGHLGDRLIGAMQAGLAAGGEAGPVHSAGMMVVDKVPWPIVDLRCDWSVSCPIAALNLAWQEYKPQIDAYVSRGLNPSVAPSYGVPGDE